MGSTAHLPNSIKRGGFLKITSNFYTIEKLLAKLEEGGIVRTVDVDRARGTWYTLTPMGRIVAEHLKVACDAIDDLNDSVYKRFRFLVNQDFLQWK